MPRIPPAELARLKAEVSVEALAKQRGVKLIRKGADLHGRCPFHDDRTPSLVITPEKNLWHCLGACQQGGTVIDWVMKAEGVSLPHAVALLRADLPKLSDGSAPVVRSSTQRKLPKLASSSAEGRDLLRRVVEHYHQTMKDEPAAREYLASRGLTHPELVSHFRLGYANRTLGYRLPAKNRQEGAALRGKLQDLGVIRKSGHEHLAGSLVVPLLDEAGNVVQLYGRKVGARLRKGTALHLYLPGPQRGVLNRKGLGEEVLLCESILDAFTFWCAGLRSVTTTYGTSGLTDDLRQALRVHGTERVLIAYDRDDAGEAGAARVAAELQAMGIAAYRVQFPRGMDANEYAQKMQPAAKSLALVVRSALWLGEGEPPEAGPTELAEEDREASKEEDSQGDGEEPEAVEPGELEENPEPREPGQQPQAEETTDTSSLEAPPEAPPPEPAPRRVPLPHEPLPVEKRGEEYILVLGDTRYLVRGLAKNTAHDALRVNLLVSRTRGETPPGAGFHVDTLDLFSARQREVFVKQAGRELGLDETAMRRDLGRVLLRLEELLHEEIQKKLAPQEDEAYVLTEDEKAEALELLRSPDLLGEILADFDLAGVVGEETNKLVGYLAATSRKLDAPLAVIIQSNSAAGKSSLMDAVLAFIPKEERVSYSAMTGQSLFYMNETNLAHKILSVAEEEGAQRASYALKLLQSEGELTIASTGKDPVTGRLTTQDYQVTGPVMIFLTTTSTEVDEELMNRCLVLTVDEGRKQTRAIHSLQRDRELFEGQLANTERDDLLRKHQNAQRLLEPLMVVNPYARELTFMDHLPRARRDHMKYLTLIRTVALLHQHQREVKTTTHKGREIRYLEATREDIAVADKLVREVLGHSLDELPPQTRRMLHQVVELVAKRAKEQEIPAEAVRFTRREVREWTGLGNTQVRAHLKRLEEYEYVFVHAGGRGQSIVYELAYQGDVLARDPLLPDQSPSQEEGPSEASPPSEEPEEPPVRREPVGGCRPQNGGVSAPPPTGSDSLPERDSRDSKERCRGSEGIAAPRRARGAVVVVDEDEAKPTNGAAGPAKLPTKS